MPGIAPQELNALYVKLHRSLLQYVGECWPWSDDVGEADAAARAVLNQAVATQRANANRLADPLDLSDYVINQGGYPSAWTDLHYVSLKYLLKQVAISQVEIIRALQDAANSHPDSPLLSQVAASEQGILQSIQNLSAPKLAVANVV